VSSASTVLCGGCGVTRIPTATRVGTLADTCVDSWRDFYPRVDVVLQDPMHTSPLVMQVVLAGCKPGVEDNVVERRRADRFELQLPVLVVREGNKPVCIIGETRNLSSVGVLMVMQAPLTIGDPIEYVIMLTLSTAGHQATRLHCKGKVLRNEGFVYATTIQRYEFLRDDTPPLR
jgi:hypothetical protein